MHDVNMSIDQLEALRDKEWIQTNGCGAYASSSLADCHTRRYHGLLVAPIEQLPGRYVLLSHVEAIVVVGETEYSLATNYYPGAVHPRGYQYIVESGYEPSPYIVYDLDGVRLRREIIMLPGEVAVYMRYTLEGPAPEIQIQLKPLICYRDSHSLSHENMHLRGKCKRLEYGIRLTPYDGMPSLYLQYSRPLDFYAGPSWEQRVEYVREAERGFDAHEDRFYPGILEGTLSKDVPLVLRVGTDNAGHVHEHGISEYLQQEQQNDDVLYSRQERRLRHHAKIFFNKNAEGTDEILAGFPWFGAWGRDTMIALPGLCLYNHNIEHGRELLMQAAQLLKNGLLPNTLSGIQGQLSYNSIDAALWYTWAIQEYIQHFGVKSDFAQDIFPILKDIVQGYAYNQTGISHCDERGLISAGDATTQLTWMDAKAWGKPVTPRYGYAIEINALWYNAMCLHLELAKVLRRKAADGISELVDGFAPHFQDMFWMDDQGYCADVFNQFGRDGSMRPNQIFAVALAHSPLSETQQRLSCLAVESELLTPYGLRTLSAKHADYCPRYQGSPDQRDASYHQGTVWPWLIGAFVQARLKISADPKHRSRDLNRKLHRLFNDHVKEYGMGSIAEIFDAEEPHTPRGCFAQAWSVAEVIRAKSIIAAVEASD